MQYGEFTRSFYQYYSTLTKNNDPCRNGSERCYISYSLAGAKPEYIIGAALQIEVAPHVYPGWRLRFYVLKGYSPNGVNIDILKSDISEVVEVDGPDGNFAGAYWRFFIMHDVKNVDRFLIRDTDSVLSLRERFAVYQWIYTSSDRSFHIMRDNVGHGIQIMAGMWGSKTNVIPYEILEGKLRQKNISASLMHFKGGDQDFLAKYVWPKVNTSSTTIYHDSFFCHRTNFSHPFPTLRSHSDDFVGSTPFRKRNMTTRKVETDKIVSLESYAVQWIQLFYDWNTKKRGWRVCKSECRLCLNKKFC